MEIHLLDEHTIEAVISKEKSINHLFSVLSDAGIQVLSMRNKTNRLEQLFMYLVEENAARKAIS